MSKRQASSASEWHDPLFQTAAETPLGALWDRVQRTQVDLGFAQELVAYYSADRWMAARSVLDLGTGNGYYLSRLAAHFPDKAYCGIDSSREFIDIANSEKTADGIEFRCLDAMDASGEYDFLIMRLLLQHIQDVPRLLEKAAELTRPDGSALIIDPNPGTQVLRPEAPELKNFLAAYKAQQAEQGMDRHIAAHLDDAIESNSRWRLADRTLLIYPTTYPRALELFRETIYLMLKIIETTGVMRYDFAKVRREWDWWCGLDDAYAQVGMAALRIDRVAP